MFKTITRRASSALRRTSRNDGAPPRPSSLSEQILRDPLPDPDTGIGHGDPLPSPSLAASLQLGHYPRNELVVVCERCGKTSVFRTHRLIAEYGSREKVSDVLALKAEPCSAKADQPCQLLPKTEPA